MKVELDEVVMYLGDLIGMTREVLVRECKFKHANHAGKVTKNTAVLFALERKFDPKAIDPTTVSAAAARRSFNCKLF